MAVLNMNEIQTRCLLKVCGIEIEEYKIEPDEEISSADVDILIIVLLNPYPSGNKIIHRMLDKTTRYPGAIERHDEVVHIRQASPLPDRRRMRRKEPAFPGVEATLPIHKCRRHGGIRLFKKSEHHIRTHICQHHPLVRRAQSHQILYLLQAGLLSISER